MRAALTISGLTWLAGAIALASGVCTQNAAAHSALAGKWGHAPFRDDGAALHLGSREKWSVPPFSAPLLLRSPFPTLSSQEFFSFSGVGAIICTINGKQHMSTAFLVGAFDVGVTVAHTFEEDGRWTEPSNCVYTSTDSLGQIRERIPVSSIKAQWETEAGAFGQLAKDFAVVRLSEPSHYAQRTMPLGKFSGAAAAVLMIGFKSDIDSDSLKQKSRGTVYGRKANGISISSLAGFTHDMDSRGIAPGAPVIDERTGVIIGIHTLSRPSPSSLQPAEARNTMITMNEWLENTLRVEMQESSNESTAASTGGS